MSDYSPRTVSAPLVELAGLHVHLGGRSVLTGVSMLVRERESWAVLGANGSGKTTRLRTPRGDEVSAELGLVAALGHVLEVSGGRTAYRGPRAGWRRRGAP